MTSRDPQMCLCEAVRSAVLSTAWLLVLLAYDVIYDLSAARVILTYFDSIRLYINFLTEIINILLLIYRVLFKCIRLAGKKTRKLCYRKDDRAMRAI